MAKKPSHPSSLSRARGWLFEQCAPLRAQSQEGSAAFRQSKRRLRIAFVCAAVFLIAFGVRLLHWQDDHLNIPSKLGSLVRRYQKHADEIRQGEGLLFPRGDVSQGNVQRLVHPPGYSIFLAGVFYAFGKSNAAIILAQAVLASLAAVVVFLIAAELLPLAAAIIASLLVALSPHLAQFSLWILPDSLAVLPILIAVYLIARATRRTATNKSCLIYILAAGVMIGLSCWLRSNALLLAPFLAVSLLLLIERGKRTVYAVVLVTATIVTISPITIRNWIVYGHFIPLSIGSGITMVEGIADYDKAGRFGMPADDRGGKWKDVEWHNRPDYAEGLWKPDGIARDRYRFARGLQVIRSNPVWFAGVMARRAAAMLRSNDTLTHGWPSDTAKVGVVAAEPSFGHDLIVTADMKPVWSAGPAEMLASGTTLSAQAEITLAASGHMIEIAGDSSAFGDQFASAPIEVKKNTDYLLALPAKLEQGKVAAKVTSEDRRIALAAKFILAPEDEKKIKTNDDSEEEAAEASARPPVSGIQMAFATGDRSLLRLVISNNGPDVARSRARIGQAELFELGATPYLWSGYLRPLIRGIQRNTFKTFTMLPLAVVGVVLLALAGRWRALIILLVIPAYYMCVQSAFHTEYRYILAIHYFLFVLVAAALYLAGAAIIQAAIKPLIDGTKLLMKRRARARRSSAASTSD